MAAVHVQDVTCYEDCRFESSVASVMLVNAAMAEGLRQVISMETSLD